MAYVYNNQTGNFDYFPDGNDHHDNNNDWPSQRESSNHGDISTILKIVFAAIEITCNYFAYKIAWGWILLTIPLTFYCLVPLIEQNVEKEIRIKSFIGYVAIMITVLTPLPWWSIIIAMVATGILVMDKSNKIW